MQLLMHSYTSVYKMTRDGQDHDIKRGNVRGDYIFGLNLQFLRSESDALKGAFRYFKDLRASPPPQSGGPKDGCVCSKLSKILFHLFLDL